jgi:hypothetical protein
LAKYRLGGNRRALEILGIFGDTLKKTAENTLTYSENPEGNGGNYAEIPVKILRKKAGNTYVVGFPESWSIN